jgi:hypothetical protein
VNKYLSPVRDLFHHLENAGVILVNGFPGKVGSRRHDAATREWPHPKIPPEVLKWHALATGKDMPDRHAVMDARSGVFLPCDRVKLKLTDIGRNALSLLGAFALAARDQGWSEEAITAVLRQAIAGNRWHTSRTIRKHIRDA